MPALVNYRGKWRDDQFNGAGDPEHIPGNDSAIISSIIFALTKGPTQGGSSKVYQLSGGSSCPPPSLIIIPGGEGVLMDRGNINFTDNLPLKQRPHVPISFRQRSREG